MFFNVRKHIDVFLILIQTENCYVRVSSHVFYFYKVSGTFELSKLPYKLQTRCMKRYETILEYSVSVDRNVCHTFTISQRMFTT